MSRLGPSGLAQLFREIANYVAKRLSDYNTKAELDSKLNTKANDSSVVHNTENETIAGTKTFSDITISNKELRYSDTKNDWANTSLNTWCDAGHVIWFDNTGNRRMHELVGTNGGVWRKSCYINENIYFNVDSNRNITYWGTTAFNGTVTFSGHTYFNQDMIFKNYNIDLTVTPSSTLTSSFVFTDKNNQTVSYIQYAKRNTDPDILGLYINDKDKNLHGIQITSNNYLLPRGNNIYNLGSSNNAWASAYVYRIICNDTAYLKMTNLESNTTTPTSNQYKHISAIANDNSVVGDIQFCKRTDGSFDTTIYSRDAGSDNINNGALRITSNNEIYPLNTKTKLGISSVKWSEVWANTFNGNLIGNASSATYSTTQAASDNSTKIATTAFVKAQEYVSLTSLAGGNHASSLTHSVGSLVLAYCDSTAFAATTSYANVTGQLLYPCRTEIVTVYDLTGYHYVPIVVRFSSDRSIGSGTWRYLGGSDAAINNAVGVVFGMFLRVA